MGIIRSAAHLAMCPRCPGHGHITLATGDNGPEFCSKESGILALQVGVEVGVIMDDEAKVVRDQIEASPLPNHDENAHPFARDIVEMTNSEFDHHSHHELPTKDTVH